MTEFINPKSFDAPDQPRPAFPRIRASVAWIIFYFIMQIVTTFAALIAAHSISHSPLGLGKYMASALADPKIGAMPTIWALVAASVITLGLLWRYVNKSDRATVIHLDRWSQLSLPNTLILAVVCVGAGLLFNELYSTYVVPDIKMQDQLRQLFDAIPKTPINYAMLFATVAIIAPAVEELLFRGLLQNALAHRIGALPAVFVAGLGFAAMHLDFYAFPALFALGSAFGYLYYRTGSLRVNIVLHMINNGAALIISWLPHTV